MAAPILPCVTVEFLLGILDLWLPFVAHATQKPNNDELSVADVSLGQPTSQEAPHCVVCGGGHWISRELELGKSDILLKIRVSVEW
jgi:hypothetical protein